MSRPVKYTSWHIFPNWIKLLERIWVEKWRPLWLFECHCWNIFENQIQCVSKQIKSCWCLNNYNRKLEWEAFINLLFAKHKYSSKKRWIDTILSLDDFWKIIQSGCEYCGRVWVQKVNRKDVFWQSFSFNGIDRVDSSIWYSLWNSVSCCKDCNFAKNELSRADFESHISLIYNHLNLWARS